MYRQGDVLVAPIAPTELPAGLVPAGRDARGRLVLARGEATGHAHVVTGAGLTAWALPDQVEPAFLVVDGYGRLNLPQDEPLVMVEVVNATPEPDGTRRTYWLRVPPDTRTARAGVAWTFGLDAEEYAPLVQT